MRRILYGRRERFGAVAAALVPILSLRWRSVNSKICCRPLWRRRTLRLPALMPR